MSKREEKGRSDFIWDMGCRSRSIWNTAENLENATVIWCSLHFGMIFLKHRFKCRKKFYALLDIPVMTFSSIRKKFHNGTKKRKNIGKRFCGCRPIGSTGRMRRRHWKIPIRTECRASKQKSSYSGWKNSWQNIIYYYYSVRIRCRTSAYFIKRNFPISGLLMMFFWHRWSARCMNF